LDDAAARQLNAAFSNCMYSATAFGTCWRPCARALRLPIRRLWSGRTGTRWRISAVLRCSGHAHRFEYLDYPGR